MSDQQMIPRRDLDRLRSSLDKQVAAHRKRAEAAEAKLAELEAKLAELQRAKEETEAKAKEERQKLAAELQRERERMAELQRQRDEAAAWAWYYEFFGPGGPYERYKAQQRAPRQTSGLRQSRQPTPKQIADALAEADPKTLARQLVQELEKMKRRR